MASTYDVNVIGYLRHKDNIGASCYSRVEGQPSHLMPHNFNNKYPAMGSRRRMNAVNGVGRHVHSAVEAE